MPDFPALAHVAVTVTDLDRSTRWYTALFGSGPVLDEDEASGVYHHTVYLVGGGQLFGLHRHATDGSGDFDERDTGLDHIAFACADRAELETWAGRLDELGIKHGGVSTGPTAPACPSATPTGSRSNSSPRPPVSQHSLRPARGLTRVCRPPAPAASARTAPPRASPQGGGMARPPRALTTGGHRARGAQ